MKIRIKNIYKIMKEPITKNKRSFIILAFVLGCGTLVSLVLPQVLSKYIDSLDVQGNGWLIGCALGYCFFVLLQGGINIYNTYVSENLGWKLCDYLRVDMFKRIFSFDVQRHKLSQEGNFLEQIEGDVNLLLGFFSTMLVDIIGSLLMVMGVVVVFYYKFFSLGIIFSIMAVIILVLFVKTQNGIANLWRAEREAETDALSEFSQDVSAHTDIRGIHKENYIMGRLKEKFAALEKKYVKASFWGNVPSTLFFSLLNIGEGIVLALGIYLLYEDKMTLGNIYLILSYVGLLNAPFFILKYEFAQMPRVFAALARIREIYEEKEIEPIERMDVPDGNGEIMFDHVSFGYHSDHLVLNKVSFQIKSGEHVLIEGRTGSGKTTVLQLIAGFYCPDRGEIKLGGKSIFDYQKEAFNQFVYYILQANPILEDSIKNNVTRYDDRFTDIEIQEALEKVKLGEWLSKKKRGVYEFLNPGNVSQDEAQLLAWCGAILKKPGILLVDEFDAMIHSNTIEVIDRLICEELKDTTVVMVTHQKRSGMEVNKNIQLDAGKIVDICCTGRV